MKPKEVIGRVELISFPSLKVGGVSARIDTGAKTSSIWATSIKARKDGGLDFILFGKSSPLYNGKKITVSSYEETVVSSSMGNIQKRYKVKLTIRINGHRIKASFSLADRSRQVYPVLIGRNVLRGKFIVDVTRGEPMLEAEINRTNELRKLLDN